MRLFSNILIICGVLLYNAACHAQNLQVIDLDTKTTLAGAYIIGNLPNDVIETDTSGIANISSLSSYDTLTISYIGYQDKTILNDFTTHNISIIGLQSGITLTDDILIMGREPDQSRTDLPAHIETLDADEVRSSHPQTAADFVSQANGVFLQKSQLGGGSPLIRGFAANRILLVLDGVRMNNAIFRSGNLQNILSVDPHGLDRVQVLLGPNSLKYGSDALGGVINMITKQPKFDTSISGYITGQYHSANQEKTSSVSLNYGSKKWAWQSNFSYSDFSDLTVGSHGPTSYLRDSFQISQISGDQVSDLTQVNSNPKKQIYSGFSQLFTQHKLSYKTDKSNLFNYSFYYSRSSAVPRYDRLIQKSNGEFKSATWEYGPQQWSMHKLNYRNSNITVIYDHINISLAYQNYQESRHDRRYEKSTLRNRSEHLNIYNLNIDASKRWHNIKLTYGTEWTLNKVTSRANSTDIISGSVSNIQTRYPTGSIMSSLAFYTQGSIEINPKLNITGGARFTTTSIQANISDEFLPLPYDRLNLSSSNVSGSLGMSLVPTENIFIYANLSSGFRTPNIDDVGKVFDSEPGNVVVPNDQLGPEKVYSGEIGIESRYSKRIKYHFGIYYMFLNDIISRQDFSFNGQDSILYDGSLSKVQSLQNAEDGYIYGIEGNIKLNLNKNWHIDLNGSYQKGEEKLNNIYKPIRHIAPFFGGLTIGYSTNKFSIKSNVKYNAQISYRQLAETERSKSHIYASDTNGNPYSPSWWTWDLKGEISIHKLTINIGLENILDKRYRPYSSGIVSAGRSAVVAMKFEF